jgi:8-oxo-dGTP diphosphatase
MAHLPYKIAVLAYIFNDAGKILLLRRKKYPNQNLYSPIGGKLEQPLGESPYACALREIHEEIGIQLTLDDIHLLGIVSERAYDNADPQAAEIAEPADKSPAKAEKKSGAGGGPSHWLMFCFEVTRPLNFPPHRIDEGKLEWHDPIALSELNIPITDRQVIWPLIQRHSMMLHPMKRQSETVFSVHIDCTDAKNFRVTHEHPRPTAKQ